MLILWRNSFVNFQSYDCVDHFRQDSDENDCGEQNYGFGAFAIEGTERWRDRRNCVFC